MDTTQGKQQETLRRGTEPHRNAITQDTTQGKRQETLRRGTGGKQQEGNSRRETGHDAGETVRNSASRHGTTQKRNHTGHDAGKTARNSASRLRNGTAEPPQDTTQRKHPETLRRDKKNSKEKTSAFSLLHIFHSGLEFPCEG